MAQYKTLVDKVSIPPNMKTKQKDYESQGTLAIVDQGKKLIGGYTNNAEMALQCKLPVIVFGDHTCAVKFVNFPFGAGADGIKVLSPKSGILPKYLFYGTQYLTLRFPDKGYARHYQHIEKMDLPVPSIETQQNIVSSIEELFSELDKGVETLQTIKEQLVVYQQAVLKEAFDSAEKDCKMLRIEEMLTKDRKGMSTGPFGTMIKKSDHKTSGVPMLGIENIGAGQFVDGNKIFVTEEKAKELKSFVLKAGDIIISRSGTVGEICAVPERADGALLSTNLMRVSLDANIVRADYFIALFQSKGVVLDQVKELCKGSTRDFLNQTILKQIVFPVPSIEKQSEIIAVIEACLSICDRIEKTVDTALAQAEAMRQSILKKAFEGELCK